MTRSEAWTPIILIRYLKRNSGRAHLFSLQTNSLPPKQKDRQNELPSERQSLEGLDSASFERFSDEKYQVWITLNVIQLIYRMYILKKYIIECYWAHYTSHNIGLVAKGLLSSHSHLQIVQLSSSLLLMTLYPLPWALVVKAVVLLQGIKAQNGSFKYVGMLLKIS